ncbi:SUF system NifU family Fe-S cluster assembly protein [bacterium]|nr:SUF system NifU family Fe-S cluster assembly protein [bacterium]
MDAELRDLYQQVIMDHQRKPRNFGAMESPDRQAEGYNPLCGDHIRVELSLDGEQRIRRAAFTGEGCAICTASASMMTEAVTGHTLEETNTLFDAFHRLLTEDDQDPAVAESLGKLALFAGVREFPVRVKCATLPWHTLHAAADEREDPVTTE